MDRQDYLLEQGRRTGKTILVDQKYKEHTKDYDMKLIIDGSDTVSCNDVLFKLDTYGDLTIKIYHGGFCGSSDPSYKSEEIMEPDTKKLYLMLKEYFDKAIDNE